MRQATWRIGWYSRVVLTIIAVSLVGLLVRQLPKKVEAKPERRASVEIVDMADTKDNKRMLAVVLDSLFEKKGLPPELDKYIKIVKRSANVEKLKDISLSRENLLEWTLQYYYTYDYRIKFIFGDLIFLESE